MEVNKNVALNVGWNDALKDAGSQLEQAKLRVQQLEDVIAVFTQKMKDGEPWPGHRI